MNSLFWMLATPGVLLASCANRTKKPVHVEPVAIQATHLTITYVKRPWYAWRGLVVNRMEKSTEEYRQVKGLAQKWYTLSDHEDTLGGIYFWDSAAPSALWFDSTWFARTEARYGQAGTVLHYDILEHSWAAGQMPREGWATLSYDTTPLSTSDGLYAEIFLLDDQSKACVLRCWDREQESSEVNLPRFFVPIFLRNEHHKQTEPDGR